jgi:hypothetical protein
MLELVTERLALWDNVDLRELAVHIGVVDASRDARINALAACLVASAEGLPALQRLRTAGMVAAIITLRWQRAGVERWVRDAGGRPAPWSPGAVHEDVISSRWMSPSGRALIGCTSCTRRLTEAPGGARACPGFDLGGLTSAVAEALVGGVVYAPGPAGLPLPEPGPVVSCLRCWRFGPWTRVDHAAGQRVCDACYELPSLPRRSLGPTRRQVAAR